MTRDLTCFILAAGLGERLRPITNHIPKPLLPIAGTPLLERIIEKIIASGFTRIGLNSHHLHEKIKDWIDNSRFRGNITLFHEPLILNTGGALANARHFLENDDFLIHNGDIITDADLAELFHYHKLSGNIATLATLNSPPINNVLIDRNGFLVGIGRNIKPSQNEKFVAFSGIAVYSPSLLEFLPNGPSNILNAWSEAIKSGRKIGSFDISGCYWSDIGTPRSYAAAVASSLRSEGENIYVSPCSSIGENVSADGLISIEQNVVVGGPSELKNCVALPGAVIDAGSKHKNSIIGPDFIINLDETDFASNVDGKGILIGTGGSDRKYYRRKTNGKTVVVMECGSTDSDFERHIEYTKFFLKHGLPVPELLDHDSASKIAVFEDLGDLSLYSWRKIPRGHEETLTVYRRIIEIIANLHDRVSDHISECPDLASRLFDYDYLRWETSYFFEKFAIAVQKADLSVRDKLYGEFHRLALKVDSFTKRIIHRDFQSQNIMITHGDIPRIIDYQSARIAPPAYDLASILWDPYAPLSENIRNELIDYYCDIIKSSSASWFNTPEFEESLIYCRLQRHMQALGAYGFLSIEKGKKYFLKFAPEAVRLLKTDITPIKEEFPALFDLVLSFR